MKFKIGTYNIKAANCGKCLKEIALFIKEEKYDIIGLNEVDKYISRSGKIDILKEIASIAGLEYYHFFKTIDYSDGEYGIGILSKYPIVETFKYNLSHCKEQRVLGKSVIDINGVLLDYYITHLELGSYDEVRKYQYVEILEQLKKSKSFVLAGDFNNITWSEDNNNFFEFGFHFDDYDIASNISHPLYTFGLPFAIGKNTQCIDNIICSKDLMLEDTKVLDTEYSDHDAICGIICIK